MKFEELKRNVKAIISNDSNYSPLEEKEVDNDVVMDWRARWKSGCKTAEKGKISTLNFGVIYKIIIFATAFCKGS